MGLLSTIGAASGRAFGLTRVGAAIRDAYFNLTTLLLPGNGTNGAQNNTFTDSSSNGFSITRNGGNPGMTQGTFSPFSAQPGAWSSYYSGVADTNGTYFAANAAYSFGTGDFTVEAWVNIPPISNTNGKMIVDSRPNATNGSYWLFGFTNTGQLTGVTMTTGGTTITSTSAIPTNQWVHVAYTRASGTLNLWVNGVSVASATGNTNNISSDTLWVGRNTFSGVASDTWFSGYMSNLRIVKGVAVYTGTFTPPASPLEKTQSAGINIAAITGSQTSLLFNQSNRFVDNSNTNATPLTLNTWPTIQPFSPFAPTAAYDATTVGGSGYFDGTGDYLSVASNAAFQFGTGDFTVEAWWYPTTISSTYQTIAGVWVTGNLGWILQARSTDVLISISSGFFTVTGSATIVANQWYHVAASRNGTTVRVFLNGTQLNTGTSSASGTASTALQIGRNEDGNQQYVNGYLSSLRIIKGQGLATGSFTPPTAPVTTTAVGWTGANAASSITGTVSLLTNFTNAGITDATAKNDLETVGNAQISTTVSKFGSGSMSFDGTGDYLLLPHTVDQMLGTGAFTIEMWIYRNASGTYGLVGKGTGTTGWLVSLNSSNQVVFTYGSSTITSTGTISATTWTYIAVVREGTGTNQTKIYISGSNDGTGTVSTDFNQTNAMYVGADRTGGSNYNGYIDDLRITKGFARTIATPSSAFALQ